MKDERGGWRTIFMKAALKLSRISKIIPLSTVDKNPINQTTVTRIFHIPDVFISKALKGEAVVVYRQPLDIEVEIGGQRVMFNPIKATTR